MENPISYSDLFDPALQNDIQGLINKVKDVEKSLVDMIATVKSQAKGLGDALSATTSSTKGGRDTTKEQADNAQKLYQSYMTLGEAYKYVYTYKYKDTDYACMQIIVIDGGSTLPETMTMGV